MRVQRHEYMIVKAHVCITLVSLSNNGELSGQYLVDILIVALSDFQ